MKAIIVGGGIGGLTAALMLHARGIAVELYEQADAIRELGVGINTLPQAIEELAGLGLLDRLDAIAIRTNELFYLNRFGQEVWREKRGLGAGHTVPQFSIHRGRLQSAIHDAVLERLGAAAVHVGSRLAGYEQDVNGVSAQFVDRAGNAVAGARGDVLIGADGIHSYVRSRIAPGEGPPRWNGLMLWRGARDWPAFLDGQSMIVAGGLEAKVVVYPIAEGERPDTRLTNWAVIGRMGAPGAMPPRREDWSRTGNWDELAPRIAGFDLGAVNAGALMRATEPFWEYPMCDRDPLGRWSEGRVTLLGDAAHPMYPVGSNGASQAILDARALADHLAGTSDPTAALAAYEAERRPLTSAIVLGNRQGGPEGVIDAVDALAPNGFADVEAVLPRAEREAIVKGRAGAAAVRSERAA
jgi:2-polyprenyl-6-methoxyphenol hydroxylase-like FAD-dependent oxidoreductase